MPSPVGHSLAALALARIFRRMAPARHADVGGSSPGDAVQTVSLPVVVLLIVAASAPDLDFIPGILIGNPGRFHHLGPSHSLLTVFAVGALVALVCALAGVRSWRRLGVFALLACASHLFLDVLTVGAQPGPDLPLFWPFRPSPDDYVGLPFHLFLGIKRDPAASNFFSSVMFAHNALAVVLEAVIMGVVLALPAVARRVTSGRRSVSSTPRG